LAAALCLALGISASAAGADDGSDRSARAPIVKTRKIAPGVRYQKIVRRQVPLKTYVLTLDLSKKITLDTALADAALPSRRPLTDIVRRGGALAGVNGDWFDLGSGIPAHTFAQDGDLLRTTPLGGTGFAVTRDESTVLFENPRVAVTLTDTSTGRTFTIDRWNQGDPSVGELAGFSPLGGTAEPPSSFACSVRLLPLGKPTVAEPDGVNRPYVVDVARCSEDRLPRQGGVVISAEPATDEAIELLALEPGTDVRLHWTAGWSNVFDVVGGGPLLLRDGKLVGICNSQCGRHPRTGVGITADGKILLVVVDGRHRRSRGATMFEFARIMRDLGARTALNLDGGGSSEMVVRGEVVNVPSDGHERAISNAILVLPGPDPGE
jgi:Phosphodiester glycosidase